MEKVLHLDVGDTEASKKLREDLKKGLADAEKKADDVLSKISGCNEQLAQNKIKRQDIRNRINELRNPALLAELNAFEEKRNQLKEEVMARQGDIKNCSSQTENILRPEEEDINRLLNQLDKEESGFKEEITLTDKSVADMGLELKEKEEKQKKFESKFKGLFIEKSKIDERIKKSEEKAEELGEQAREIEQRINGINVESAKTRAELSALEEEFKEYEGVEVIKNKSEQ